jgi:transcription antitermination factor NusG
MPTNAFRPGNRVKVLTGKAAGLIGEVVSVLDAHLLWMHSHLPGKSFIYQPGQVCVAVVMSGVRIPLALDVTQVVHEPP